MEHYDVAVVGGGVHGLFSAYALALRGKSVVVCEQFEFGHLRGSSHGATKIFRLSYADEDYVKLALNSLSLWRQIEDDAQVSLIEPNGCVDHGNPDDIAARVNAMDNCGVASEVLDREEARFRWPNLDFDETIVFHPGGGRIYARATLTALRERCEYRGVVCKEFFEVSKIVDENSRVILESDSGAISADTVVCAAGAWTHKLLTGTIDFPAPKVSQEQTLYFSTRDPGAIWPNVIRHQDQATFSSQEAPGVGIMVSGVRMGTYLDDVSDRDYIVDPLVAINVCDFVERYMPGLEPQPLSSDTCVATFSDSKDFVIDRVGNIVVAMACQQKGFSFAPIVGKYVADLVDQSAFPQLRFRL